MKKIHKFILMSYMGPMVLTFFIMVFILIMNFMWRYIDELVGKGLTVDVLLELMLYVSGTMLPMALPLATLLAAIMTIGNLGENYELQAMKSAGMSLLQITKPLIVVVLFIAAGGFFAANNLVPYSTQKLHALIYDIRQQKQTIEFKDGIFFNGLDNISIRVEHQNKITGQLFGVLIYDTQDYNGNMTTTVAKSGFINLSEDKHFLSARLYNGVSYEQTRNHRWLKENELKRNYFKEQHIMIPLDGFNFSRSDAGMFGGAPTMRMTELEKGIDSLTKLSSQMNDQSYKVVLQSHIFTNDRQMFEADSVRDDNRFIGNIKLVDSLVGMDDYKKKSFMGMPEILFQALRVHFHMTKANRKEC